MKTIGIIGAGPAGLMTAIQAKNDNNQVIIFEKNDRIGKKLLMTGGGRCNITNVAYYDDFLVNVITNRKFLYSSYSKFDNYALIDLLNENGIETIVEDNGKVFPKSQKSSDIVKFFEDKIKEKSIDLKTNTNIKKIYKDEIFYLTDQNNRTYTCDNLIIATGGSSYPNTGSDGYGYTLADKLGHKIVQAKAVLVPIFIKDNLNLKAQSFKEVKINIETDQGQISISGDLMINAKFLTGPAALKASSFMVDKKIKSLAIDFLPKQSYNEIEEEILNLIKRNSKKSIGNALKSILNFSLLEVIFFLLNIDMNKKASELTKDERNAIIEKIKSFNLQFERLGSLQSAIVTRGGVDVASLNPKNMQSRLVDGLFFVGEILDIDSLTGGFNLQTYLTTAYAAGTYIKEN